jgi:hypothetical protein
MAGEESLMEGRKLWKSLKITKRVSNFPLIRRSNIIFASFGKRLRYLPTVLRKVVIAKGNVWEFNLRWPCWRHLISCSLSISRRNQSFTVITVFSSSRQAVKSQVEKSGSGWFKRRLSESDIANFMPFWRCDTIAMARISWSSNWYDSNGSSMLAKTTGPKRLGKLPTRHKDALLILSDLIPFC